MGGEAVRKDAEKTGRFDYDREIAGLRALDRYTFRLELLQPDFEFVYNFASKSFAAVAREVVSIATSAIACASTRWARARSCSGAGNDPAKIELVRNPTYREDRVPTPTSAEDKELAKNTAGRRAPLVDSVVVTVLEESSACTGVSERRD